MASIDSNKMRVPVDDLWRLLVDPYAVEQWTGGNIDPRPGGTCRIADRAGVLWNGRVMAIEDGSSLTIRLSPPDTHDHLSPVDFTLRAVADGEAGSRLSVECDGDDERMELVWAPAIDRLEHMAWRVSEGREPQQAVVVIHGIGEQRPGDTLRSFVEAVAGNDRRLTWSRPDYLSGSYELRRLTLWQNQLRPRTDFYEYYWAHQIRDTKLGDVVGWTWSIMGRPPWKIPAHLRTAWGLLWGLTLAAVLLVVSFFRAPASAQILTGAVTAVLGGAAAVLNNTLGDAARYLSPRPNNVAHRQAIREGGIDLVRRLHESGRYNRVILVGHSLGSVVAYDIITGLWQEMNNKQLRPDSVAFRQIASAAKATGREEGRSAQGAVWREMRRNTQPWLVTDLVTLGSPLAHAELLMARNAAEFDDKKASREFPTAPPLWRADAARESQEKFSFDINYRTRSGNIRSFTYLDHGAPFAAVRWTNLYFPLKWGLFGDPVGGAVAPMFGDWVCDVPLTSHLPWWKRFTVLAHTQYWRLPKTEATEAAGEPEGRFCERLAATKDHIEVLRKAVALGELQRLETEAAKHDPVMYL